MVARAASRNAGYGLGVDDVARFAADGCRVLVTGDCGTSDHEALRGGARARPRRHRHRSPRAADGRDGGLRAGQLAPPRRRLPVQGAGLVRRGVLPGGGAAHAPRRGLRSARAAGPGGARNDRRPGAAGRRRTGSWSPPGSSVLSARKRPGLAALARRAELTERPHHRARRGVPPDAAAQRRRAAGRGAAGARSAAGRRRRRRAPGRASSTTRTPSASASRSWSGRRRSPMAAAQVEDGVRRGRRGRRGLAPGRRRHHRRAPGRPVRAAGDRDRVPRRGRAGLGAHRPGREPVRGAGRLRAAPDQVRRPRRRRRHEHRDRARWTAFRAAFAAEAARQLARPAVVGASTVDAEVTLARPGPAASPRSWRAWRPFGAANREPLFALSGVTARTTRVVGQGPPAADARPRRRDQRGDRLRLRRTPIPGPGARVDLVATAELDTFRGLTRARG